MCVKAKLIVPYLLAVYVLACDYFLFVHGDMAGSNCYMLVFLNILAESRCDIVIVFLLVLLAWRRVEPVYQMTLLYIGSKTLILCAAVVNIFDLQMSQIWL